jgi:hypothetical protein
MKIPQTYLSFHAVDRLTAHCDTLLSDTPLMLTIEGAHGATRIALFVQGGDFTYTERLADAINAVPHQLPMPGPAGPSHEAAHDAADLHYKDLVS